MMIRRWVWIYTYFDLSLKELKSLLNFQQLDVLELTTISLCFIHSEIVRNRQAPIGVYHCVVQIASVVASRLFI